MKKAISIIVIIICIGCVPQTYYKQKPSTTLLTPTDNELINFYSENQDGIECLAEFLNPQRKIIGLSYKKANQEVKIVTVNKGLPGDLADIRVGDIIVKINGNQPQFPLIINSPVDFEIKRGDIFLKIKINPILTKYNNAVETQISVLEIKEKQYIYEKIITGITLNTVQYKSRYDRSRFIVSSWATFFWKINSPCLETKVLTDNIAIRFEYSHKNFVTDKFKKGTTEVLDIISDKSDIINFVQGDLSVQELIDSSIVFINNSREKLLMQ